MQTWRSRRSSSANSRPPGWQTVSSRSPKNTSRTCGVAGCGVAGGALVGGALAGDALAGDALAEGALAGGALAGFGAGTLAAPPPAEENKPASIESGLDQGRSGGADTARSPAEVRDLPASIWSGADPPFCRVAGPRFAARSPESITAGSVDTSSSSEGAATSSSPEGDATTRAAG